MLTSLLFTLLARLFYLSLSLLFIPFLFLYHSSLLCLLFFVTKYKKISKQIFAALLPSAHFIFSINIHSTVWSGRLYSRLLLLLLCALKKFGISQKHIRFQSQFMWFTTLANLMRCSHFTNQKYNSIHRFLKESFVIWLEYARKLMDSNKAKIFWAQSTAKKTKFIRIQNWDLRSSHVWALKFVWDWFSVE